MEKKKTVFERLSSINVNSHVKKKGGFNYLTWSWAWAEAKKACPDATYKVLETDCDDDLGFMCHTSVTIEGETLEMWLPVMDNNHQSMKRKAYTYSSRYGEKQVEAATTYNINKSIMRCLVKNLAMFGLAIYIYSGEDLPEEETSLIALPSRPLEDKIKITIGDINWEKIKNYVISNKDLGADKIFSQLGRKYDIDSNSKLEINKMINTK